MCARFQSCIVGLCTVINIFQINNQLISSCCFLRCNVQVRVVTIPRFNLSTCLKKKKLDCNLPVLIKWQNTESGAFHRQENINCIIRPFAKAARLKPFKIIIKLLKPLRL